MMLLIPAVPTREDPWPAGAVGGRAAALVRAGAGS